MTTAFDRADYVSKCVQAALEAGGPLHVELSDLVANASWIAMEAAGLPDVDDRGRDWPLDQAAAEDAVAEAIWEAMFRAALAYGSPPPAPPSEPQLSVVH